MQAQEEEQVLQKQSFLDLKQGYRGLKQVDNQSMYKEAERNIGCIMKAT